VKPFLEEKQNTFKHIYKIGVVPLVVNCVLGASLLVIPMVEALKNIPLDDTVAEGPHSRLKRVMMRSHAATWPYSAADLRMADNMDDIESLAIQVKADVNNVWCMFKDVVKCTRLDKGCRTNIRNVQDQVYKLHHLIGYQADPTMGCMTEDGDRPHTHGSHVIEEESAPEPKLDLTDYERLLRGYLKASLHCPCFISVPFKVGTMQELKVFQLLGIDVVQKLVKTFRDKVVRKLGAVSQPWVIWNWDGNIDCNVLSVFKLEDVGEIDLLQILTSNDVRRSQIRCWRQALSDVEGCIELCSSTVVAPTMSLKAKDVPILCLVDALTEAGYAAVRHTTFHRPNGPLEYDERNIVNRRYYLQCVLASLDLWRGGAEPFDSVQCQTFYMLLLRSPRGLVQNRPAREYMVRFAELTGDVASLGILERSAAQDTRKRLARPTHVDRGAMPFEDEVAGDGGADDDEVAGDAGSDVPDASEDGDGGGEPPTASGSEDGASPRAGSSSSASHCATSDSVAGGDRVEVLFPSFLDGMKVRQEKHRDRDDLG
jgi:hypothetical protein